MIVSASRRTDIPSFYGRWFLARLQAGHCVVRNPYNQRPRVVSLALEQVDAFVFWTKHLRPFLPALAEVEARGFPFVVQHTLNAYPRALEERVPPLGRTLEAFALAAERHGPRVMVWRYDTIVLSTLTPLSFHIDNFGRLSEQLRGSTDEVVVSFAQLYAKTRRNLQRAASSHAFEHWDPTLAERRELLSQLSQVARAHGMRLSVCCHPELQMLGVEGAHCIDRQRLSKVAGRELVASPKPSRPGCGCVGAVDIGAYDTCPHGCVYCYAVSRRETALRRYREHDPRGESL